MNSLDSYPPSTETSEIPVENNYGPDRAASNLLNPIHYSPQKSPHHCGLSCLLNAHANLYHGKDPTIAEDTLVLQKQLEDSEYPEKAYGAIYMNKISKTVDAASKNSFNKIKYSSIPISTESNTDSINYEYFNTMCEIIDNGGVILFNARRPYFKYHDDLGKKFSERQYLRERTIGESSGHMVLITGYLVVKGSLFLCVVDPDKDVTDLFGINQIVPVNKLNKANDPEDKKVIYVLSKA